MKLDGMNVFDGPGVDDARCDVSCVDQPAQPLGGVGVDLVVEGGHAQSAVPPWVSAASESAVTMGNSLATARGPRQRWAYSQALHAGTRSVR